MELANELKYRKGRRRKRAILEDDCGSRTSSTVVGDPTLHDTWSACYESHYTKQDEETTTAYSPSKHLYAAVGAHLVDAIAIAV